MVKSLVAGSIPSFQFKFSLHFDFGTLADLNGAVKIEFTRHDSQKVKCLSIECSAVVVKLESFSTYGSIVVPHLSTRQAQ